MPVQIHYVLSTGIVWPHGLDRIDRGRRDRRQVEGRKNYARPMPRGSLLVRSRVQAAQAVSSYDHVLA
jgi:hypothetical protein